MAKVRLPPIGFWSYVRRDDERNRNKISELRDLVLAELETQIGGDVPVFKDTISIPHGVRWEELTTQALSDATFFIPILTPAFLQSEWCCTEVRLFLERERELQAAYPDLPKRSRIFPILYVDIEDADTKDEFVRDTLLELQHFPFQRKRNLHYHEPEVQNFIAGFVTDIRDLLRARVELPEAPPPAIEKKPRKPRATSADRPAASPPPPAQHPARAEPTPPPGRSPPDPPFTPSTASGRISETTVYGIVGAIVVVLLLILAISQCSSRSGRYVNNAANDSSSVGSEPMVEENGSMAPGPANLDSLGIDNPSADAAQNRADAVRDAGENRADAIEANDTFK